MISLWEVSPKKNKNEKTGGKHESGSPAWWGNNPRDASFQWGEVVSEDLELGLVAVVSRYAFEISWLAHLKKSSAQKVKGDEANLEIIDFLVKTWENLGGVLWLEGTLCEVFGAWKYVKIMGKEYRPLKKDWTIFNFLPEILRLGPFSILNLRFEGFQNDHKITPKPEEDGNACVLETKNHRNSSDVFFQSFQSRTHADSIIHPPKKNNPATEIQVANRHVFLPNPIGSMYILHGILPTFRSILLWFLQQIHVQT